MCARESERERQAERERRREGDKRERGKEGESEGRGSERELGTHCGLYNDLFIFEKKNHECVSENTSDDIIYQALTGISASSKPCLLRFVPFPCACVLARGEIFPLRGVTPARFGVR